MSTLMVHVALSPMLVSLVAAASHVWVASQLPLSDQPDSWYRVTIPARWSQNTVPDGVRFVRTMPGGAEVVVQLRQPITAAYTPVQVVERLLASIETTDGITAPVGTAITTQVVNGTRVALVARSYLDRTGTPVYLYLLAVPGASAIGVLQAESRSAAAYNAVKGEIMTFASSLRVIAKTPATQVSASLLTAAPRQVQATLPQPPAATPTAPAAATPAWPALRAPWPEMADGTRLSGVWTMIENGLRRVYGGTEISSVERAYVYWPDGRVLMAMPSGGVMHPGETTFAGITTDNWGRYVIRGDRLEMTWGASGRQEYALARVATAQLDRGTIRPASAPARDLRLRGTWEDVAFEGRRWIRFDETGRFTIGPVSLPNRTGAGTYAIEGYAMLLRFDDGASERLSFYALEPGATPRTITLERQTLPLRK